MSKKEQGAREPHVWVLLILAQLGAASAFALNKAMCGGWGWKIGRERLGCYCVFSESAADGTFKTLLSFLAPGQLPSCMHLPSSLWVPIFLFYSGTDFPSL